MVGEDAHSGLELLNESGESPYPAPAMIDDAGELIVGELTTDSDSKESDKDGEVSKMVVVWLAVPQFEQTQDTFSGNSAV